MPSQASANALASACVAAGVPVLTPRALWAHTRGSLQLEQKAFERLARCQSSTHTSMLCCLRLSDMGAHAILICWRCPIVCFPCSEKEDSPIMNQPCANDLMKFKIRWTIQTHTRLWAIKRRMVGGAGGTLTGAMMLTNPPLPLPPPDCTLRTYICSQRPSTGVWYGAKWSITGASQGLLWGGSSWGVSYPQVANPCF